MKTRSTTKAEILAAFKTKFQSVGDSFPMDNVSFVSFSEQLEWLSAALDRVAHETAQAVEITEEDGAPDANRYAHGWNAAIEAQMVKVKKYLEE